MSFWGRLLKTITGQARNRIPRQMELLGAPADLVDRARKADDETQEALFLEFADRRHACALDWKATSHDVIEGLLPLLSEIEKTLLPATKDLPDNAVAAVAMIRSSLAAGPRTLIQTETFGDFSILILVPNEKAAAFSERVGPWQIL